MKIVDLKASAVEVPFKEPGLYLLGDKTPSKKMRFILIEMYTDEGVKGIGVQEDLSGVSVTLINNKIKHYLIENEISPFQIEIIVEYLRNVQLLSGQCSGVEVAAWDIIGKKTEQPIASLLGGYREKIKAYVSTGELRPAESRIEDIEKFMEQGFDTIKLKLHSPDLKEDLKTVQDIRAYFGEDLDIMVDAHHARKTYNDFPRAWTREEALWMARALEELDVLWLEEPLPASDLEGLAELCNSVDMAIAGGESEYGIYRYRELINRNVYDVINCDVTLSGGFLETKKIAAMAQAAGKWCVPHAWSVGAGIIANLHLCCAIPNCPFYEFILEPPALDIEARDMVIKNPLEIKEGYVSLPAGPGLGVELRQEVIDEYTVKN